MRWRGLTSQICEQGTGRARAGELGRAVGQWHGPGVRWWDWAQIQDTILWRCWTPCGDGATLDLDHWGSYLQPRALVALTYHTHTDTHIQGRTHTRTHTCKVHSATHKHLCHLGSGTWYWHRVTHNPKLPSSQPTVFRPQGKNSSHLVLYPWNIRHLDIISKGPEALRGMLLLIK